MKSHRVLIFGLDHQGAASTALQQILEPCFNLFVQHYNEPAIKSDGSSFRALLQRCLHQVNPNLAFVVLPASQLIEMRDFLASGISAGVPVIIAAEASKAEDVFELLEAGAADFIIPPLDSPNILPRAWRLLKQSNATQDAKPVRAREGLSQLIGNNPSFVAQVQKIQTIADCEANVLILGETGTGKELYARGIHYCSARAGRPFMPVNCGAIPLELVENELFGHERGAFTSAANLQTGLIAEANGGTLFLDEIDCLPVMAQVKLLRFLQEKEYRPLGSTKTRQANVRIIAASNLDLAEAVGNGKVRQDLFYRLNVISLTLPPLRERPEDIPLLARHFLDKYLAQFNRRAIALSPEALNALMIYRWPGNVRELEHLIERAIVLCSGPIIRTSDLAIPTDQLGARESLRQAKAKEIARFEKNYIQALLGACKGNITKAAAVAQKNRRAFWQLIQKYEINVSAFKTSPP